MQTLTYKHNTNDKELIEFLNFKIEDIQSPEDTNVPERYWVKAADKSSLWFLLGGCSVDDKINKTRYFIGNGKTIAKDETGKIFLLEDVNKLNS